MAAILDIQDLDFAYGQRLVLKHVSLPVEAGTTLGIVGPNGGGKTTLLHLLLGLLEPTRGKLAVAGLAPSAAVRRGDLIGFLPQRRRVAENFPVTVRQFVQLGLCGKTRLLHSFAREDLDFAEAMLGRVGIADLAGDPIGSLSGGQLQRAFFARAVAARPKILLLDEPTTGIDQSGQQQFMQFLQTLKTELALTVVLVSHDLRTVLELSDRIACLNVTLHYHDATQHMPADLIAEWLGKT